MINRVKKVLKKLQVAFWALVVVLLIRSLFLEPFVVPSGSMMPTLLIGDYIVVSKAAYDLKVPFTQRSLFRFSDPKRGDVIVFDYPNYEENEKMKGIVFVKRVVGIGGDKILIEDNHVYLNGESVEQRRLGLSSELGSIPGFKGLTVASIWEERFFGSRHEVPHLTQRLESTIERSFYIDRFEKSFGQRCLEVGAAASKEPGSYSRSMLREICEFEVPQGYYFVVGDNRDASSDGRDFGFVERKAIKGRAFSVAFSVLSHSSDPAEGGPWLRWSRSFHPVR